MISGFSPTFLMCCCNNQAWMTNIHLNPDFDLDRADFHLNGNQNGSILLIMNLQKQLVSIFVLLGTWLLVQCTGGELCIFNGKDKKVKDVREEQEGKKQQETLHKKVVQNTRVEWKLVINSPSCGFPGLKRRWIYFMSLCVVCFCPHLQLAATFQP